MPMNKILITAVAVIFAMNLYAQNQAEDHKGGITSKMLSEIQKGYSGNAYDKAVRNALNSTSLNVLAENAANLADFDTHFSNEVKTKGRTDQKSSGRCWLFTGLNVLRAEMMEKHGLSAITFSQNYLFFYDQLEKANLFLQGIIDTKKLPFEDRKVDWLFKHPINDGGQFTGVANLVTKYGVVPSSAMPETFSSNNTAAMRAQISNKLREDGLKLRKTYAESVSGLKGKKAVKAAKTVEIKLHQEKTEMLKEVYHILAVCLGVPPTQFEWARYNAKGEYVETERYTPKAFYAEFLGNDLENNYIMVMNDPSREYNQVYEIEYDRHVYDGQNWKYLNLSIDRIKEMAIASIKDNKALYFSCDVGKFLNKNNGLLDINNYDYSSLLGVECGMDKKDRIRTYSSSSSHAMTLIAVDIKDGKSVKWMVENSWGDKYGYKGNLIMTDNWFDEYMFRLVVDKKYVPKDLLKLLDKKPIMLPSWDPMFAPEN